MSLLEHAINELKIAGFDIDRTINHIDTDNDYNDLCAKCAYDMLERFVRDGHSGFSGSLTLQIFNKLATYKCLSPLTDKIDEWNDVSKISNEECLYQSRRQLSCFSDDGLKTFYDIDAEENKEYDSEGNKVLKPKDKWVHHKLLSYR